jgi:hypothetical protein
MERCRCAPPHKHTGRPHKLSCRERTIELLGLRPPCGPELNGPLSTSNKTQTKPKYYPSTFDQDVTIRTQRPNTNYQLQAPNFQLLTPNFQLLTPNFQLLTPNFQPHFFHTCTGSGSATNITAAFFVRYRSAIFCISCRVIAAVSVCRSRTLSIRTGRRCGSRKAVKHQ